MTVDEILRACDEGVLTADEVFGHVLPLLLVVPPETIRERLRAEAGREEGFDGWLVEFLSGAEVVSGGQPLTLTEPLRAAMVRYREARRT